jgi:hypothetical protein
MIKEDYETIFLSAKFKMININSLWKINEMQLGYRLLNTGQFLFGK